MLLPDKYASWSRMRTQSFLERKTTHVTGEVYSDGRSWDIPYPYVEGQIHVTVDQRFSGWKWSRAAIRSNPRQYDYLKSFDFGGPFVSNRIAYVPPKWRVFERTDVAWNGAPTGRQANVGPPFPCFHMWQRFQHPLDARSMPVGMEWGDLWALGGSMIARTMPTVPTMNLSVSLAELLREGLPKKLGSSLRKGLTGKHAAEEFLNYTFGYSPVLADLRTLALVLPSLEAKMKQLVRDNGRVVRRGLDPKTLTTDESWSHWTSIYGSGEAAPLHNSVRLCRHEVTRTTTTWFSAAYFYDLPTLPEISSRFEQMRYVLGLNLDALTIWNLIPWSWLVDWLLPVSPVLQNLSVMARNNVRIQRAYIMCHSQVTETATNGPYSATLSMSTRQRDRASPWGFGVKASELTATQLAILASIGLSRSNI